MTTISDSDLLSALRQGKEEAKAVEERERLRYSYADFIKEAWPALKKHEPFIHNWHLDALACHLEAVSRGEIHRLQIWIPPGTMKTGTVTVFWHPWEWTTRPWLRYFTASYEIHLVQRFSLDAQQVVKSPWYQARWPEACDFTLDAASYWKNTQGGSRFATTPKSTGTGEHGHRIVIDDPVPARAADNSADLLIDLRTLLNQANEWYDGTASSRWIDNATMNFKHARVLVMQRLHENDLAAHMLDLGGDDWTILCLPERFEEGHPYAWRGERIHPAVKPHLPPLLQFGDPRAEGELIWPARRDERASRNLEAELGTFRAAGQLQQRPAPREGNLLKRDWWKFYDPRHRGMPDKLPKFSRVVVSVDTPLKDKESSDNVAITAWGIHGSDRYLLDIDVGKMNYGRAKRRVTEMCRWSRKTWRHIHTVVLIENAGYGIELVEDLKRELDGIPVQKISPGPLGDKVSRAEAASDVLESGHCWLPGAGPPWLPVMDEARTPPDVNAFVHECATFPFALHDDSVDSWSQAMNWIRSKSASPARGRSLLLGRGRP